MLHSVQLKVIGYIIEKSVQLQVKHNLEWYALLKVVILDILSKKSLMKRITDLCL